MELNDKIIIYQTIDGQTSIEVKLENEIIWFSANQMVTLFDRDEKTTRKHINNVFFEGELEKENNTLFLRVDVKNNLTPSCVKMGRGCCSGSRSFCTSEGW